MKSIISIIFFALTSYTIAAQDWAPVGATWHYSQDVFAPPENIGYIKYEVLRDSLIDGKQGKVIQKSSIFHLEPTNEFSITQESLTFLNIHDSIYFFDTNEDEFKLLYDFNADQNDTITIWCNQGQGYIELLVDSVSTININGFEHKTQFVRTIQSENGATCYMDGMIIQNIGWIGYLFAQSTVADPPEGGDLRCYSDNTLGEYKIFDKSCDFTISKNHLSNAQISLFPNPVNNFVQINVPNQRISKASIFNLSGQEILMTLDRYNQFNMSNLPNGIYVIFVVLENEKILTSNLVKSK